MSKKLLKIKIQTKPVLKEGPSDVDTLLLEFAKLSKVFMRSSEAAREARAAFKAFAKGTKLPKRATYMNLDPRALETVGEALTKAVEEVPKVLDRAEEIFKQTLRNTDAAKRADDADAVLSGLKAMKKRLAKIANVEGLNQTSKRKAIETIRKIEAKIDVIEGLMDSSISYISAASRRAKQASKSVEDLPSKLPNPQKVKDLGEEGAKKAMKEVIEQTGEEGAKAAAKEGSKWRKWLIGAGLLATATAMYKVGTKKADADDKKPTPTPTPTPGGGGGSSSPGQLAVQVTGISDEKTAIAEVQSILTELGFSIGDKGLPGNVTPGKYNANIAAAKGPFMPQYNIIGIYGPRTKQAVKKFQEMFGLKADGKIGTNTWSKMMEFAKSDKNKRWQGGKGYRSMVAQAIDLKEKGGDKKKDAIQEPSKAEKVQAIRSIDALIKQLLDGNGWQRIINSYVEVQNILVTKLMNMMDASRVSDAFKQNLRKQVQKALPSIPEGTPEERLKHAALTMKSIPLSIKTKTLNSIDSSIVGKDIVEIILTVLERNIKEMEAENKNLEESKKYDLDFSKWSKIF